MLEAKPVGIFSRDFNIEAEGRRIALLDVSHWKEAGEISIDGQSYRLFRERLMSGAFILEKEGQAVARAVKPSAFRSQFDLELEARPYMLKPDSLFKRSFSVFRNEASVGNIRRAGFFTRRAMIDLPSEWPLPVQVFVFWLVVVIWNRDDSAAAAGS